MPSSNRVEELRDAWAPVTHPSKVLLDILQDEKKSRALWNMIHRHYKFISAERSTDDERGEMTVFDKLLVDLWNQQHQLTNIGLFEFFIEEFMMGKTAQTYREKKAIVFAQLHAQELIDAAFANPEHPDFAIEEVEKNSAVAGPPEAPTQDNLERLIRVYQEAKADVYFEDADKSSAATKGTDKFKNVCFLRDSAENVLRQMMAVKIDSHPLLPEIKKMVDISSGHAERLAGGRKRIFEVPGKSDTRPFGPHWKRHRAGFSAHGTGRYLDSWRPDRDSYGDREHAHRQPRSEFEHQEVDDRNRDRDHGRNDRRECKA